MYKSTKLSFQMFLRFYALCQTNYWLCYNALREYVTKIIHSTRSVQNIPNLSNKAFVFTCIQRCTHGNGLMWELGSNYIADKCKILLLVWHFYTKQFFHREQWYFWVISTHLPFMISHLFLLQLYSIHIKQVNTVKKLESATESMFFYCTADIKRVKMVSNRRRQVVPIAPFFFFFFFFFSKHYIDHHIHLQSFQAHVKGWSFSCLSLAVLTSQLLVQTFFSLQLILKNRKVTVGKVLSLNFRCLSALPSFSPRPMLITMTEQNNNWWEGLTVKRELIYEWMISYDIPSFTLDIYYLPTLSLTSIGETEIRGIKCPLWNRLLS